MRLRNLQYKRAEHAALPFIMLLLMICCTSPDDRATSLRFYGGRPASDEHSAQISTAGIILRSSGRINCSGSLVASQLLVTARHCLTGYSIDDLQVYFPRAEHEDGRLIEPVSFEGFLPLGKAHAFPNLDIAWIKLAKPAPRPYEPAEIWHGSIPQASDEIKQQLKSAPLEFFGFPSVSFKESKLETISGQVSSLVDGPRFINLVVAQTEPNTSSCPGDSGGPVFIRLNGRSYLLAIVNGTYKPLTPSAFASGSADCTKGSVVLTGIGYYSGWLAESSGVELLESLGNSPGPVPGQTQPVNDKKSFVAWCQWDNLKDPSWLTVHHILERLSQSKKLPESSRVFFNCQLAAEEVSGLVKLNLAGRGLQSIDPLEALPNLAEVDVSENQLHTLTPLSNLALTDLNASSNHLKIVDPLPITIKKLNLEGNEFQSIGIENLPSLTELNILGNPVCSVSYSQPNLNKLKTLSLSGLCSGKFDFLLNELRGLDTLCLYSVDQLTLRSALDLQQLSDLELGEVDLDGKDFHLPKQLKRLRVTRSYLSPAADFSKITSLSSLHLDKNAIPDLAGIKFPAQLKLLNLEDNLIEDLTPLIHVPSLAVLKLKGNPIDEPSFPINEENCPTTLGPSPLRKYCAMRRQHATGAFQ